jgi:prefoldin subunit 5
MSQELLQELSANTLNAIIKDLQQKVDELRDYVYDLQATLGDKDRIIADYQTAVQCLQERLSAKERVISSLEYKK